MNPWDRFLDRLGIRPSGNELHARLVAALRPLGHATNMERLIVVRGVLAAAHEDAALAVGKYRAKYETALTSHVAAALDEGKTIGAADRIGAAKAQEFKNGMHEAEAFWRAVKEHLRTVDKDIDKTRSEAVDARQQRAVETYGGGI